MDIRLKAVKKTVWQMIEFALTLAVIYVVVQCVPAYIILLAVVAALLVGSLYLVYKENLSTLKDEEREAREAREE